MTSAADPVVVQETALGEARAAHPGRTDRIRVSKVENIGLGTGEETRAFSFSVDDRDPASARAAAIGLETRIGQRLREKGILSELLDRPSLPQWPVYPNRTSITVTGGIAGLACGAVVTLWKRRRVA